MSQQAEAVVLDADLRATDVPAPTCPEVTSRHVRLTALPSAVPWARQVVRHLLRECQLHDLMDPELLLVSELVTNAIQASARRSGHTPDGTQMISLTVRITDASLVTEVWDTSPDVPALQEADLTRERGRGLLLVDLLADDWGHHRTDGGKVVWCKVGIGA